MSENSCPFCGNKKITAGTAESTGAIWIDCSVCGSFAVPKDFTANPTPSRDLIAAYLYHNIGLRRDELGEYYTCYLGARDGYEAVRADFENLRYVSPEEIAAFYPKRFSERIDRVLLALARRSGYFGKTITIQDAELRSLLFIREYDRTGSPLASRSIKNQDSDMLEYLNASGYIKYMQKSLSTDIKLTATGWKAIEQLQINDSYNRDVFVAMSFDEALNPIRDAIRRGTTAAGFSAEFMDEIIHNRDIVPEMLRLIRESRLLIMDISQPNYGAYYEAGYALGLGKEVIITCSQETYRRTYTTEEERRFEKYLKPHFDIAQKQILVWSDCDDLARKLEQWIRALFR